MSMAFTGDLRNSKILAQYGASMRADLTRLTAELASGQVSDTTHATGGNFAILNDVEHQLRLGDAQTHATREAGIFFGAAQASLGHVNARFSHVVESLLALGQSDLGAAQAHIAQEGREAFGSIVSALNTQVAGRSVFAGVATGQTPLSTAEEMLADLRHSLTGMTDYTSVKTSIENWFDQAGGGFDSMGYRGAQEDLSAFSIGHDDTVLPSLRADDSALKDVMKSVAFVALAFDDDLAFSKELKSQMFAEATSAGLVAQDGLIKLQADVGAKEARIERAETELNARLSSLRITQSELLAADPYETVTRLQDVQARLEGLYTTTARLSQLSLARFLQ